MGEPRLAMKPVDASRNVETITENGGRAEFANSWSPDGKVIVYTVEDRKTETNASRVPMSLWTVTLGSKPESRLWLGGDFRNFAAAFSPDGRSIAYVSDESGQREVYLRPYPGPGSRIKVSTNGGEEPAWSRGGRELFYRASDQFFSVELSTDPEPVPGTPRVLFAGPFNRGGREDSPREYDVSADGSEFIAIQSQQTPEVTRQLIVLTGLFGPDWTGAR